MRKALAVAIVSGLAASAHAQAPSPLGEPPGFDPRVMTVVAAGKVHFIKDGDGCPAMVPACTDRAFLVPGDAVVAMSTRGDWVRAVFTAGPPHFRSTSGWLPRAALAGRGTGSAAPADWAGKWESGDQQEIKIEPMRGDRAEVIGDATWGGDDPARVARGGVNLGYFDTTITLHGAMVTFSPSLDDGHPATMDPPLDTQECVIRLRRLGPYLVAADNTDCGGVNVTFAGVYRRDARK